MQLQATYEYLPLLGPPIRNLLQQVQELDDDQLNTLAYNLELAAYETCTNIIEHAYGGEGGLIELYFCLDQTRTLLTIGIHDTGQVFNFQSSEVHLPEREQMRGYGLYLVQQLVDEIHQWSAGEENHWRLIKKLRP